MIHLFLNSIALEPNRWTAEKIAGNRLDKLLAPIAETGFCFVEVWQYHISRESEVVIKSFRDIADSCDIQFPVIGMYPKLHLAGKDQRDEMDLVKKVFNDAKILGAKVIKIFPGNVATAELDNAQYQRSVGFMTEMANLAETLELTITGETHPNTCFDSVQSCLRFLKSVNCGNFKICFQPYDLNDTEKSINNYRALASDVIHVHFQGWKKQEMELLENSDLDYKKLIETMFKSEFEGYICIEFVKACVVKNPIDFNLSHVLNNAKRDRDFVMKIAKQLGAEVPV